MAVAADMGAAVDHGDLMPRLGQMPPDHRAGQPAPTIRKFMPTPLIYPWSQNIPARQRGRP